VNLDFGVVPAALPFLLRGALLTIALTLASQALGTFFGFFLALGRMSRRSPLRGVVWVYVWIFRGTPLLLHLFLIYYGAPLVGVTFDAIPAAIIAMTISSSAYNCEIIRAGLQSVGRGQIEAAQSIGMRWFRIVWKIVVPQAVRVIIPPYMSNFISHAKSSSLASVITVPELMLTAQEIYSRNYRTIEILVTTGAIYLAITTGLTLLQLFLERWSDFQSRGIRRGRRRRLALDEPMPVTPESVT
jgi:polar amino acid transport system permease protein/cystine transport system permease protein